MKDSPFAPLPDLSAADTAENHKTKTEKGNSLFSGRAVLLLIAFLLLSFTAGYRYAQFSLKQSQNALRIEDGLQIAVHVKGAVARPGVYLFQADQRVADAVQTAQPLDSADLHQLNLAAYLLDGTQIQVPYKTEQSSSLLNINTATAAQLENLPGIGPSKARDILSYRETHGYFSSIEDLSRVSGISTSLVEELRDWICLESA